MKMQVLYALAGILTNVGDYTVSICKSLGCGNVRNCFEDFSHKSAVLRIHGICRRNVRFGNHQDMHRRHRMNVTEGIYPFILENLCGRNLPRHNFAEQTIIIFYKLAHFATSSLCVV